MKYRLLLLVLFFPIVGFSQSRHSDELFAKGVELYNEAKYGEAIPMFEAVQKLDRAEIDSTNVRWGYGREWLAGCYFHLGDTARAAEINPWGFDITPTDRRLTIEIDSLRQEALALEASNPGEAAKVYQKCAELYYERFGETDAYALLLLKVLEMWAEKDYLGKSDFRDLLVRVKTIFEMKGATHGLYYCRVLDFYAQRMAIETYYKEAVDARKQQLARLPEKPMWMHYNALRSLCGLYYLTQDKQQLQNAWRQLVGVTEELYTLDKYAYANALYEVGRYYYNLGLFQEALELKNSLISLYVKLEDSWQADYQRLTCGLLLRDMNRNDEARLQFDEVLSNRAALSTPDDTTLTIIALAAKSTLPDNSPKKITKMWKRVEALLSDKVNVYTLFYLFMHQGAAYSCEHLHRMSDEIRFKKGKGLTYKMLTFATYMGALRFGEATEWLRVVCDEYKNNISNLSLSEAAITNNIISRFFSVNKKLDLTNNLGFLPEGIRPDSLIYQNNFALNIVKEMNFYTAERLFGADSDECWSAFFNFYYGCEGTYDYIRSYNVCRNYSERMKQGNENIATENYEDVLCKLFDSALFLKAPYKVLTFDELDDELKGILREILRVERVLYGNEINKYSYVIQKYLYELGALDSIPLDEASNDCLYKIADIYYDEKVGEYGKAIEIYKRLFGRVSWIPKYVTLGDTDGSNLSFRLANSLKKNGYSQSDIAHTFDSLLLANRHHKDYLNMACNTLRKVEIGFTDAQELLNLVNNVIARDDSLWNENPELKGIILLTAIGDKSSFYAKARDEEYIGFMVATTKKMINDVKQKCGTGNLSYDNFIIFATASLMSWNILDDINHILPSDIPDLISEAIRVHEARNYTATKTYRALLYWQMRIEYDAGRCDEAIRIGERIMGLPKNLQNNPLVRDNVYRSNYFSSFSFRDDIQENDLIKRVSELLALCYQLQNNTDLFEQHLVETMRCDVEDLRGFIRSNYMSAFYGEYLFHTKSWQLQNKATGYVLKYKTPVFCGFAYDAALFIKGLLLRSQAELERTMLESGNESLIALCNELRGIRKKMAGNLSAAERDSLGEKQIGIYNILETSSHKFGDYTRQLTLSWQDVRSALRDGEIAIEFVQGASPDDGVSYIIALILRKGSEPQFKALCPEEEFSLAANNRQRQYELIWEPLHEVLAGVKNIYFSPSMALHQLPMESLPRPDGSAMCDAYNMYRLSNTREIIRPKKTQRELTAALFGGVEYELGSEQWQEMSLRAAAGENGTANRDIVSLQRAFERGASIYLPGTEIEVGEIDKLLQGGKVGAELFTGVSATEEAVKQLSGSPTAIVHIATHGFFQAWNGVKESSEYDTEEMQALSRSGLLMAGAVSYMQGMEIPDNVDDGILTARELAALDLTQTELITLSACETGLGDVTSDGVFGLQRGLKKAGANSILMSLWKVDDEATCMLMTEFYRLWVLEGKSKREALELAKQLVRSHKEKGWDDPKYWAAFILLDGIE